MSNSERHRYRRIVLDSAARIILCVNESDNAPPPASQLWSAILSYRDCDWLQDISHCDLTLRASDSPEAQSFRNTRMTNSGAVLNVPRWAGLALASDIRETVCRQLRVTSFHHPETLAAIRSWQHPKSLRADFSDETPWLIIADWHEELGESRPAALCREMSIVGEYENWAHIADCGFPSDSGAAPQSGHANS